MQCPQCGYLMQQWEAQCPRCTRSPQNVSPVSARPPLAMEQPKQPPSPLMVVVAAVFAVLLFFGLLRLREWRREARYQHFQEQIAPFAMGQGANMGTSNGSGMAIGPADNPAARNMEQMRQQTDAANSRMSDMNRQNLERMQEMNRQSMDRMNSMRPSGMVPGGMGVGR